MAATTYTILDASKINGKTYQTGDQAELELTPEQAARLTELKIIGLPENPPDVPPKKPK